MNCKQKSKILIVDDEIQHVRILMEILENNYEVIPLINVSKALIELESYLPDIILLNINLPEMISFDLCKELKSKSSTKKIPVIFLTHLTQTDDIIKGFNLGGIDYIVKPFKKNDVILRVKKYLNYSLPENIPESDQELKNLLGSIYHSLINPTNSLLELFKINNFSVKNLISNKDLIKNTLQYIFDIVDFVHQMYRFDEYMIKRNLQPFRLKKLIQTSISMNHSKLEEKEIEIECNVDEGIYIITEKLSFINSVMNTILRNAIKYSYPKSKIFISVRKSKDADEVILSVKDYGIGIPEQIQKNLFRINIPTTRAGTSGETGIGFRMALLKKLMNAYGGRIEVKSSTKTSDRWTEVLLYFSENQFSQSS